MVSVRGLLTGLLVTSTMGLAQPATALDTREIQVVGTWGNLSQWKNFESEFWNVTLPADSEGQLTANAKPMDELGLSGFELMRQLKLGVFDVVHTLVSYTANDLPMAGGIDLAGLVRDREAYGKMIEAFRPILASEFEKAYGAKILALYSFSSYSIMCDVGNSTEEGMDILKGQKVRSHNISMADFLDGVGAVGVTIPFAEVVPSIQQGVVDCGVTGLLSAYEAKWWQVTNRYFSVPLGYGTVVVAANQDFWNSLSPETQAFLEAEVAKVEQAITANSIREDELGMACYGSGPCEIGEPGNNIVIPIDEADQARLREVVADVVLKRFAERCGPECTKIWNDSIGKALGISAAN